MFLLILPESELNVTEIAAIKMKKITMQEIRLNIKKVLPVTICFLVREICSLLYLLNLRQITSKIRKATATTNNVVKKAIVVPVGKLSDRTKIMTYKKLNAIFNA